MFAQFGMSAEDYNRFIGAQSEIKAIKDDIADTVVQQTKDLLIADAYASGKVLPQSTVDAVKNGSSVVQPVGQVNWLIWLVVIVCVVFVFRDKIRDLF